MINCNPETVSTDFDVADKLYFEPVFWEHLYEIILHEKPLGVIVQLGWQTALKLSEKLNKYGIKILGTTFDSLDLAEDRGRFSDLLKENKIPYPEYGTIDSATDAIMKVAIRYSKPFAIVPCCVFPTQFPKRRLPNGQSVQTYDDFCEYIRNIVGKNANGTYKVEENELEFEGRNKVFFY